MDARRRRKEKRGERASGRSHDAGGMGRKPGCDLRKPAATFAQRSTRSSGSASRKKKRVALEATMKSAWASIEADADLTHAVTRRDQKRQRHVNEMTEIATRMKMAWLRVSRSIEQLDPALADPSKRLFAELVSAASLYDRMEMLDDPVQFALDHYEISNARLIETSLRPQGARQLHLRIWGDYRPAPRPTPADDGAGWRPPPLARLMEVERSALDALLARKAMT